MDISGDLSSPLAHSRATAEGPIAAVAVVVCAGVHRNPRHRLTGGGAGDPLYDGEWCAVSRPRSDLISYLFRHSCDAGGSRFDAVAGDPRAWPGQCRAP